ncbi:MAG: transporter [Bacteroidales bacterium]|nr:transporter [Bacteroidales bacterium]
MMAGVFIYLTYHWIPALHPAGLALEKAVLTIQPILIFLMLFLQFSRTSPHDLKFRRWHIYLLLIQTGACLASAAALLLVKGDVPRILLEALMLCWICPTAIAAGVVTEKIGGSISGIMSYIILVNLLVSILIPIVFPMVHPNPDQSFLNSFLTLLGKVFPTLILPAAAAWTVRYTMPKVQNFFMRNYGKAFQIWLVSLCLAIIITTRSIVHSNLPWWALLLISLVPAVSCLCQFAIGHKIGEKFGKVERITAGQALGQKNTTLMIWIGYVFLTPLTSIAGGIYCICHNLVNSAEISCRSGGR